MYRNTFLLYVILYLTFSCSEDNEIINNPPIADFEISDRIDTYYLISSRKNPDNDMLSYEWKSESEIISINDSKKKDANFKLPALNESKTIGLSHTVYDGQTYVTAHKDIQLPILTEIRSWGLGRELKKEISNNVDYDWYLDQRNTGQHWELNCGPTTVTMAIKWYNKQFSESPEDARNTYITSKGWNGDHITSYLKKYSVTNSKIAIDSPDSLINELEKGNIIILQLDMMHIPKSTNDEWHVDKFYRTSGNWSHFIILKGYKLVDKELFIEVYDPNSNGAKYKNNSFKGKDRYYRFTDLDKATKNWSDFAVIVSKDSSKSSIGVDTK